MDAHELFIEPFAHISAARALEGLTPEAAEHRIGSAPHSVAEIVAHLRFWQEWFLLRCEGGSAPMAAKAEEGWPEVVPGSWPILRDRFLEGLERLEKLGASEARDRRLSPPVEFPPLASYTVDDALVHTAIHNAHHLGQIILLRQLMGLWPPPSGGLSW